MNNRRLHPTGSAQTKAHDSATEVARWAYKQTEAVRNVIEPAVATASQWSWSTAEAALSSIHKRHRKAQKSARRLQVRCIKGCRVLATYFVTQPDGTGRYVVEAHGDLLVTDRVGKPEKYTNARRARAGDFVRHRAYWVDELIGHELVVGCDHGHFAVNGDELQRLATEKRGTGVSALVQGEP